MNDAALGSLDGVEGEPRGCGMNVGAVAERLSGGVADPLRRSRLSLDAATLRLDLDRADHALYGEIVSKRHAALAGALGRVAGAEEGGRDRAGVV